MSTTFMPPAPPAPTPPALLVPVAYATGGGAPVGAAGRGSSYGPVIAMLAVVAVLAAAAVAVGRLCFGRRAQGHAGGAHDLEAWVERTCGPCVGATALAAEESREDGGDAAAAAAAMEPEGTERGESTTSSA
ncbi:uncharacterized protein LOC8062453 [Sorghum bicolor]|uniref:Uncharacterized protein n=1 Tax=Sorghum bicolor TaxID=4558 RepID=A0A1W0W0V2_SORBI|nr:uncharacterized protein LOC8062453 [Sorghum bicolor]OQU88007.1 hypothetical protein SORBI_3003G382700 [Sorghum bicolor]|eukprot:XP_002458891.2 uncharacterized protein LOC8062453 [Sorghum bicolor]